MGDFRLIAFTRAGAEPHEWRRIESWLGGGFDRVHLRKPGWSAEAVEEILRHVAPYLLPRITLHDQPALAVKYGIGFQTNARYPRAPEGVACRSHSCHTIAEARAHAECDYVTLSPIFPSISKPGYQAAEDMIEEYREAKNLPPVVALGGVDFDKLPLLREAGFAGAAMLGALYR